MTGSPTPPHDPARPSATDAPPAAWAPTADGVPSTPSVVVPGVLGRVRIGHVVLGAAGAIALVFMAKTILYKDPVKEMTDELRRIGSAETAYRATHQSYTASLPELQQQDRKVKLRSQLVQFEAGRNGYQVVVRRANTDRQCTLIAGSFKPLGGDPEVSCAAVSAPR